MSFVDGKVNAQCKPVSVRKELDVVHVMMVYVMIVISPSFLHGCRLGLAEPCV